MKRGKSPLFLGRRLLPSFRQHHFRHDRSVASLEGPGRWIGGSTRPAISDDLTRDVFPKRWICPVWPLFMPLLIAVPVVMGLSVTAENRRVMHGLRNIYNFGVENCAVCWATKLDAVADRLRLYDFGFAPPLPSCPVRCILPYRHRRYGSVASNRIWPNSFYRPWLPPE